MDQEQARDPEGLLRLVLWLFHISQGDLGTVYRGGERLWAPAQTRPALMTIFVFQHHFDLWEQKSFTLSTNRSQRVFAAVVSLA